MHKLFYLFVFAAATSFFSSCDKVENPYPPAPEAPFCDTPAFVQNTDTARTVLLEDFTGHRCPNCPYAGYIGLQEQANLETQGKKLLLVAVHATDLAEPLTSGTEFLSEYRTEAGDDFGNLTNSYSEFFGGATGFAYVPIGMIDRAVYNTSTSVDIGDWTSAINDRFNVPAGAMMQMEVSYDAGLNKACVWVETEFRADMTGDFNLVVYIVEDSIVDWQTMGMTPVPGYPTNQNIDYYTHRHVLRDAVNGTWGQAVATGSVVEGEKIIKGYTYDFNDTEHNNRRTGFNKEHISFIAYVYRNDTKEILQAVEMHME